MPINITMPALSPTMEEGTLAKWLVGPGDVVGSGDIIAEIETDKATMEVEAVDEGVLAKILVAEGTEGVAVNSVIAVLAEDGEEVVTNSPTLRQAQDEESTETKPKANKAPYPEAPHPERAQSAQSKGEGAGRATKPLASTPLTLQSGDRIKASPLAKRIAALKGIDLSGVTGTGPHGRIVKRDVADARPTASSGGAPASPDGLILPQILDERVYAPGTYELKPLDGMRKVVAKRLTQSFMQVPHFPLTIDVQLDKLLAARKGINEAAVEGVKISVNDMVIKAAALALMAEPECNASYTDNGIAYHKSAHVSVAVAIDGGLITPVIFDAQDKGLADISAEMKDLAVRARTRKLKPQEYMGGTFSLSNLGMFGIRNFASIINPPEGMILSVGAGEKRPVASADGSLGVATVMGVTLTCDHRVVGGAEGARWLTAFKRFIETPEAMLL